MEKIICYVDGYNLYHSIKDKPSANINLKSLAQSLLQPTTGTKGEKTLSKVHYFSAYATWRQAEQIKHRQYVKRLETDGVTVTMSHFKSKPKQCRNCNAKWKTHEEKETDVRLALQVLEDAVDDNFDTAFIFSGDSDMVPAIEIVKRRYPEKRILVVLPKHQVKYARDIKAATHGLVNLSPSRLKKHLY